MGYNAGVARPKNGSFSVTFCWAPHVHPSVPWGEALDERSDRHSSDYLVPAGEPRLADRTNSDLQNDLARLDGLELPVGVWGRKRVQQATEHYGLPTAESRRQRQCSVQEWLDLGARVYAHIRAMQALNDLGLEALADLVLHERNSAIEAWTTAGRPLEGACSWNLWIWSELRNALGNSVTTPAEYRRRIASQLENAFWLCIRSLVRHRTTGDVVLELTPSEWLNWLLADSWWRRRPIRVCKGCNRLFIAKHASKEYCHGRCRKRRHDGERRAG